MANIVNQYGQVKVGVRTQLTPPPSSLWTSVYAVYNADATGSSSLKTSLYAAYNGESNTNDSFGSNNGTAQGGLTYGTGKIGTSFVGNGTNAYVSLPNNSWNFTGTFSINIWAYLSSSSTNSVLYSNYYYSSGGRDYGFLLEHQSNGNLRFYMQTSSNSPVILSTSYSGKYNSWKMITITKLQNGSLKMYIDGVNIGTNNNTPDVFYNSINYSTICAASYLGVTYGYLENGGKLDAVNIWQKELSTSEITDLYNSGNGSQYITDSFYKPTTSDALNTYNGTAQGGLTYTPGKIGTAFNFNGTNSYVSFTPGSFNSLTTDFSISAWVYLPSGYNSTNNCPIFSNMSAPGWFETPGGFWFRFVGTTIQLGISGKLNPTWLGYNISNDNLLGTWIHVVAVRKNSTSSKIYINNVLKASNTDTVNPVYYTGVNLTIPTIGNVKMPNGVQDGYYAYDGSKIDAVGIWNKSLTESEITELYNSGNGKQYTN